MKRASPNQMSGRRLAIALAASAGALGITGCSVEPIPHPPGIIERTVEVPATTVTVTQTLSPEDAARYDELYGLRYAAKQEMEDAGQVVANRILEYAASGEQTETSPRVKIGSDRPGVVNLSLYASDVEPDPAKQRAFISQNISMSQQTIDLLTAKTAAGTTLVLSDYQMIVNDPSSSITTLFEAETKADIPLSYLLSDDNVYDDDYCATPDEITAYVAEFKAGLDETGARLGFVG